jgi:hypothetical protein
MGPAPKPVHEPAGQVVARPLSSGYHVRADEDAPGNG